MKSISLAIVVVFATIASVRAATGDTIVIGFTASETGKLNADSTPQLRGFQLWRDQVNAAGGMKVGEKQYKVNFASYDDQSKTDRVQQLYNRLIAEDGADFLFSPYSSGLTATAAIVSEQNEKIMITTGAAEDKTYKLGNKYLFQMYTPATQYLVGALDALHSVAPKSRVAIAYKDDPFAKAVISGAIPHAKKLGFEIVFDEAYSPQTTDFGPIINKIITANADAVIGGGHYDDGATLARQVSDRTAALKFVSLLVAPDSPQFAELGTAAVGVTVPSQWAPQVQYKPDFGPRPEDFAKIFRDKFGAEPGYHAAGGYAAGLVLQQAIEKAGSLDTAKVAEALNATDAGTFYGRIKFATDPAEHGLQVGHQMVISQWQRGSEGKLARNVVWPETARTKPLVYPMR
jgi:branched-chain amino acid transport system substrate-binding protein